MSLARVTSETELASRTCKNPGGLAIRRDRLREIETGRNESGEDVVAQDGQEEGDEEAVEEVEDV